MENTMNAARGFINSPAVREKGKNILGHAVDFFTGSPSAILALKEDFKSSALSVRDEILLESLETYILGVYSYNEETQQFEAENLRSLAAALAEASPNYEADYQGNEERLVEYAKRIIKLLDDCGTKQKVCYLANLTRALISGQLDTTTFFKLSRCIRNLTEEDLFFLSEGIKEGIISGDEDYIDDYRALGLLLETDGGFAYTKRAFELQKYALKYEISAVEIPQKYPSRLTPISHDEFLLEDVQAAVDASTWKTY